MYYYAKLDENGQVIEYLAERIGDSLITLSPNGEPVEAKSLSGKVLMAAMLAKELDDDPTPEARRAFERALEEVQAAMRDEQV